MKKIGKIGLGGGCHWCTEAVFSSLAGVSEVRQGYLSSTDQPEFYSEGILIQYEDFLPLQVLIEIHLHTHSSNSDHLLRSKYKSAVYTFSEEQAHKCEQILTGLQNEKMLGLVTEVLPFSGFRSSREEIMNYFYKDPNRPFCRNYIQPKIQFLQSEYSAYLDASKLSVIQNTTKDLSYEK